MLGVLIKEAGYADAYGSSALKALQNNNLPELDLMVREAIQNSSDAALDQPGDNFSVDINIRDFVPKSFNYLLTDLTKALDERYPIAIAKCMEIRDSQTSGLTGPIYLKELDPNDHGNFFKLVYDTGKEQTAVTGAGSWGYGKSVYYRVGVGLVVFYSRIKINIGYESRLIITLVEKETSEESLLKTISTNSIGKAWWGVKENNELLPLRDNQIDIIKSVLEIFGVAEYTGEQTGTSVIIPYIEPQELLKEIIPATADIKDDERERCLWAEDISEYLKLAIQKWYAPKINNTILPRLGKKWLRASVNGDTITRRKMRPMFRLVQDLYTMALIKAAGASEEYVSDFQAEFKTVPVKVVKYLDSQTTGYVATVKISKHDLFGEINSVSPYTFLRLFDNEETVNEPIIMFTRDPGMIIDYTIIGEWTKGIVPPETLDDFIFAFYVPTSTNPMNVDVWDNNNKKILTLGEYLRHCEKSDHMSWYDQPSIDLIAKIKRNTANMIKTATYKNITMPVEGTASKLSGKLGRRLLPRIGFGKSKNVPDGGGGSVGGGLGKNVVFSIYSSKISDNMLELEFELEMKNFKKTAEIVVYIESETGLFDAASWEDTIETPFPVMFHKLVIQKVYSINQGSERTFSSECTPMLPLIENEFAEIKMLSSERFKTTSITLITAKINNTKYTGKIVLLTTDKTYCCAVKAF